MYKDPENYLKPFEFFEPIGTDIPEIEHRQKGSVLYNYDQQSLYDLCFGVQYGKSDF